MTLPDLVGQLISLLATLATWVAAVRRTHPYAIIFALVSTGSAMASLVLPA